MMLIDDTALRALWQQQQPPTHLAASLRQTVRRQRRWLIVRRAVEVLLTVVAVALLAWPDGDDGWSPAQWLLIPYFSVYLLVAWIIVLRGHAARRDAVTEPIAVYARLRQHQLRTSLRDLKIAEASALALSAYAIIAMLLVLAFADAAQASAWRNAAGLLMVWAALWHVATYGVVRRGRRRALREYRGLRRQQ